MCYNINMEKMIEQNAIIKSAMISTEEGYLSVLLDLEYGEGVHQGFGTYCLYSPHASRNNPDNQKNYAGIFIWRCMQIARVSRWSDMVGKVIRVRKPDYTAIIEAIGHPINDDWFYPKKELGE